MNPGVPNDTPPKRLTVSTAAQILGVHRVHLSYVIHGHRASPELLGRYRDLTGGGQGVKTDPAQEELPLNSILPHVLFPGRTTLRVAEVADALNCTIRHVIDLCQEGLIAGIDIKGGGNKSPRQSIRIPVSAYDAYVRASRIGPKD